jgi:hypothetical protein
MAADTRTRDKDLQLWVELDAVSIFLANLLSEAWEGEFLEVDPDTIAVGDFLKGSLQDVNDGLWRSEDDYEGFAEWKRASARSSVLAARIFAYLTTVDGREACQTFAERHLQVAERMLREADDAS